MAIVTVRERPPHPTLPFDGLLRNTPVVQDIWELRNRGHQVLSDVVTVAQNRHKKTFQRLLDTISRVVPLSPSTRERLTAIHTASFGVLYDSARAVHWYF